MLRGNGPSAPADSGEATPAVTPEVTATPEPTATLVPTADLGTLPRPVQRAIERYREACGQDAPLPEGIESMNKKEAEEALDPLTKACDE